MESDQQSSIAPGLYQEGGGCSFMSVEIFFNFFVNHLLSSFVVPEKSVKLFKSVCSRAFEDGILKEFVMHFVLLLLFSTFCMNLV